MSVESLKASMRTVPDFPRKGILFWDITTLLKDPAALHEAADIMYEIYKDKGITKVAGLESRGFMLGAILADRIGAGFVMIRKPGKLPAETIRACYQKEYGEDCLEIHKDAVTEDDVVLLHDDLLATGGSMSAGIDLVKALHPKKLLLNFLVEIEDLKGRDRFPADVEVNSVIKV